MKRPRLRLPFTQFLTEYYLHTALNLGQAARDIRYFYFHPESESRRESRLAFSLRRRAGNFATNLFYSAIPPQLHHTREELESMLAGSALRWFLHGYAPWRFASPAAALKVKARRRSSSRPRA